MGNQYIYHMCRFEEWESAHQSGSYLGSSQDLEDGFIHFSTREQIHRSAAKHRAGQEGLVLLTVETQLLGEALKWESSRGGELFPHLYGELSIKDVTRIDSLYLDKKGKHIFPIDFLNSEG